MKQIFLELLGWSIWVAVIFGLAILMQGCQQRIDRVYMSHNMDATAAFYWVAPEIIPDSIKYVTSNGDTIWYIRTDLKKLEWNNFFDPGAWLTEDEMKRMAHAIIEALGKQ